MVGLLIRRSKAEIRTPYYGNKEEYMRKEENCNSLLFQPLPYFEDAVSLCEYLPQSKYLDLDVSLSTRVTPPLSRPS